MADSLAAYLMEHPKTLENVRAQIAKKPDDPLPVNPLIAYHRLLSAWQLDAVEGSFPTDVQQIMSYYKTLPVVPGSSEQLTPQAADRSAEQAGMRYVANLIEMGPKEAGLAADKTKAELLSANDAAQKAVPNTLDAFLLRNNITTLFFDPPTGATGQKYEGMRKSISTDGDFTLTPDQMTSARMLAQEVLDLAKSKKIDITQFEDIQKVMGYDKSAKELNVDELAGYLVGKSFHGSIGPRGTQFYTDPDMEMNLSPDAQKRALEAGRQVFGDTNPTASSTNTQTPESMQPITDLSGMRVRC